MTNEHTATFNALNEAKKKLSSIQNDQIVLHRRMADLVKIIIDLILFFHLKIFIFKVKRHEEQLVEKEKDCLARVTQRDEVNRVTFNELRALVNRQQRMIVK